MPTGSPTGVRTGPRSISRATRRGDAGRGAGVGDEKSGETIPSSRRASPPVCTSSPRLSTDRTGGCPPVRGRLSSARTLARAPGAQTGSQGRRRETVPAVRGATPSGLHRERHLKHHSRWQLTRSSGADMSVDKALAVWRSQFSHGKMADFQREHTYAVRHSFGLEGKMADYPPHTCERLGKTRPGATASRVPVRGLRGRGRREERSRRRAAARARRLGRSLRRGRGRGGRGGGGAEGRVPGSLRSRARDVAGDGDTAGPAVPARLVPRERRPGGRGGEAAGAPKDGGGGGGGGERGGEGEGGGVASAANETATRGARARVVERRGRGRGRDSRELRELREVLGNA